MKGVNPAWANLPRRKCDDCGASYKPKQPLREGQRGFCKDACRKSYHKHGGAYRKLRTEMRKMVEREFKTLFPLAGRMQAEITELRQLWIDTEARYVELKSSLDPHPPKNYGGSKPFRASSPQSPR